MSIYLSDRVQQIKPSPTLTIAAKAAALKAQGVDMVSLSTGEPDFDTPDFIKEKAIEAIHQGFTKYTAVEGIVELRRAIVDKFAKQNQLLYTPDQILISAGGKQGFFNLCQALINPLDEVIIPAPYWVSYPDIVLLAGGKPVIVSAGVQQHFKITPQQLEKAITPKTRLLVINSPSNPTGMAYTADELTALAKVLLKHPQVFIATDDMYEHILWRSEPFSNLINVCPELYERTIILHGVSKTYAMTGWRIGFNAGPKELIQAMSNIQSQSTSNACSISQKAAFAAITGDQSCIPPMVAAFKQRTEFVVQALREIDGVRSTMPDGTFYVFPEVQPLAERLGLKDDLAFTDMLLERARVAVVPGTAFGAPGYIRISTATSLENLQESMRRLRKVVG